ncbi:MAG: ABC transporter ATP-binding protein [Spirochaetes bacterium]|nr:ABC transporter ATP-binding protein [Spirochaetota bacterium]
MLRVRNLVSGYGNLTIIRSVSLHVKAGEIVTIIGGNGAGKTTLLNTIAGIIQCREGEIVFEHENISKFSADKIAAKGLCLVPEGRQIFSDMTVRENLEMGAYIRYKKENKEEINTDIEKMYNLFPILQNRKHQRAGTLSGGEQQMLAIARALMGRPKLLILDEPSLGLAPIIVQQIFAIIKEIRNMGNTILLVEQNAKAALKIADRGYVMETGQILLEGTTSELFENRDVQRAYLGKEYRHINE